jgi:hypothetical protein
MVTMAVRSYEATSLIDAPREQVWRALTDIIAWPERDSGVTKVEERLAVGEKLSIPDLGPSFQQFANGLKAQAEQPGGPQHPA